MGFQKVSSQFNSITFGEDEGSLGVNEAFIGFYTGVKLVDTKYGKDKKVYTFKTEDGTDVEIWGSATLNIAMSRVGLGNLTKIVYTGLGEKKRGQNPAKLFDVEQDPSKRIEVEAPKVSFREEESDDAPAYSAEDDTTEAAGLAQHRSVAGPASRTAAAPSADRQAKLNALLGKRTG